MGHRGLERYRALEGRLVLAGRGDLDAGHGERGFRGEVGPFGGVIQRSDGGPRGGPERTFALLGVFGRLVLHGWDHLDEDQRDDSLELAVLPHERGLGQHDVSDGGILPRLRYGRVGRRLDLAGRNFLERAGIREKQFPGPFQRRLFGLQQRDMADRRIEQLRFGDLLQRRLAHSLKKVLSCQFSVASF